MIEKLLTLESDKVASIVKRIAKATRKKALVQAEGQSREDFLGAVAKRIEKGRNAEIVAIKNELTAVA